MSAVSTRRYGGYLVTPSDHFLRYRIDEHLSQFAAIHFGPLDGISTGFVQEDRAVFVDDAFCILTGTDEGKKGLEQTRSFDGKLSVVFVKIEKTALRPCMSGCFRFIDGSSHTMEMENPGKGKAAESGTDDCDWVLHDSAPLERSQPCGLTVATCTGQLHSETLAESHRTRD